MDHRFEDSIGSFLLLGSNLEHRTFWERIGNLRDPILDSMSGLVDPLD